jgi:hypothetical protein
LGASLALCAALTGPAVAGPAAVPGGVGGKRPAAYLIHLIDGRDPIVVQKYIEEGGQVRFEKYGGWVGIPSYEVLRIVPDELEDASTALPLPAAIAGDGTAGAPLYVATQGGGTVKATAVGATGQEVRVSTPEGALTFHRADLVGVVRVPAAPASPEAWITLWGSADGNPGAGQSGPSVAAAVPSHAPVPTLTDRPHLLQLASGVVLQVNGFWLEAGEVRFRRLGGVVGFALGEIARLVPQEVGPIQARNVAWFVRQLGRDGMEVRLGRALERIRLIGVDPIVGDGEREDPWAELEKEALLRLEFDRERYAPDGTWLAYVYLPNGRMLNAELIRVGLARPRAEAQNVRYLDLFEELWSRR